MRAMEPQTPSLILLTGFLPHTGMGAMELLLQQTLQFMRTALQDAQAGLELLLF